MKQEQIQKQHKRKEVTTEDLQEAFNQERNRADRDRLRRLLGETAVVIEKIDEVIEDA